MKFGYDPLGGGLQIAFDNTVPQQGQKSAVKLPEPEKQEAKKEYYLAGEKVPEGVETVREKREIDGKTRLVRVPVPSEAELLEKQRVNEFAVDKLTGTRAGNTLNTTVSEGATPFDTSIETLDRQKVKPSDAPFFNATPSVLQGLTGAKDNLIKQTSVVPELDFDAQFGVPLPDPQAPPTAYGKSITGPISGAQKGTEVGLLLFEKNELAKEIIRAEQKGDKNTVETLSTKMLQLEDKLNEARDYDYGKMIVDSFGKVVSGNISGGVGDFTTGVSILFPEFLVPSSKDAALGAASGAGLGYTLGSVPGAVAGTGIGAVAGLSNYYTYDNFADQILNRSRVSLTGPTTYGGDLDYLRAYGAGLASASIDAILGKVAPGIGKAIIGSGAKGLSRKATKSALGITTAAGVGGMTEGLQQVADIYGSNQNLNFADIFTDEKKLDEITQATLVGAIVGGGLGTVGATGSAVVDTAKGAASLSRRKPKGTSAPSGADRTTSGKSDFESNIDGAQTLDTSAFETPVQPKPVVNEKTTTPVLKVPQEVVAEKTTTPKTKVDFESALSEASVDTEPYLDGDFNDYVNTKINEFKEAQSVLKTPGEYQAEGIAQGLPINEVFNALVKDPESTVETNTPEVKIANSVIKSMVEAKEAEGFYSQLLNSNDTKVKFAETVESSKQDPKRTALVDKVKAYYSNVSDDLLHTFSTEDLEQIVETRGKGQQYHGTKKPIEELRDVVDTYNEKNIYGAYGMYTTDAVDIAKGYQRKSPTGVTYRVEEKVPVRMYDMEQRIPIEGVDTFKQLSEGKPVKTDGVYVPPEDIMEDMYGQFYVAIGGKGPAKPNDIQLDAFETALKSDGTVSLRDFMDAIREVSEDYGYSAHDVQDLFDSIHYNLGFDGGPGGYGGVSHKGGVLTGREPHLVKIYYDPKNQLELKENTLPTPLPVQMMENAKAEADSTLLPPDIKEQAQEVKKSSIAEDTQFQTAAQAKGAYDSPIVKMDKIPLRITPSNAQFVKDLATKYLSFLDKLSKQLLNGISDKPLTFDFLDTIFIENAKGEKVEAGGMFQPSDDVNTADLISLTLGWPLGKMQLNNGTLTPTQYNSFVQTAIHEISHYVFKRAMSEPQKKLLESNLKGIKNYLVKVANFDASFVDALDLDETLAYFTQEYAFLSDSKAAQDLRDLVGGTKQLKPNAPIHLTKATEGIINRILRLIKELFGYLPRKLTGEENLQDVTRMVDLLFKGDFKQSINNPSGKSFKAFHGSPHTFDKFQMSKMGTGEGAQAYGKGLYFAGNKKVADFYKDTLGDKISLDGKPFYENGRLLYKTGNVTADISLDVHNGNVDAAIEGIKTAPKRNLAGDRQEALTTLEKLKGRTSKTSSGNLYEVEILADPDSFVSLDAPLKEQKPEVREFLTRIKKTPKDIPWLTEDYFATELFKEFKALGVNGIKYQDAGSRSSLPRWLQPKRYKQGTYNYVVFDDSKVKITSVNEEAVKAINEAEVRVTQAQAERIQQSTIAKDIRFSVQQVSDAGSVEEVKKVNLTNIFDKAREANARVARELPQDALDMTDIARDENDYGYNMGITAFIQKARSLSNLKRVDSDFAWVSQLAQNFEEAKAKLLNAWNEPSRWLQKLPQFEEKFQVMLDLRKQGVSLDKVDLLGQVMYQNRKGELVFLNPAVVEDIRNITKVFSLPLDYMSQVARGKLESLRSLPGFTDFPALKSGKDMLDWVKAQREANKETTVTQKVTGTMLNRVEGLANHVAEYEQLLESGNVYVPEMRFGNFAISVKNPNTGELIGMYTLESPGVDPRKSRNKQLRKRAEDLEKFVKDKYKNTPYTVSPLYELTYNAIGKHIKGDQSDANLLASLIAQRTMGLLRDKGVADPSLSSEQLAEDAMTYVRTNGMTKHLLRSRHVDGASEDAQRVRNAFFSSMSQAGAFATYSDLVNLSRAAYTKDSGSATAKGRKATRLLREMDYAFDPIKDAPFIRSLSYNWALGFNPSTAAMQLVPLMSSVPMNFASVGLPVKGTVMAMKDSIKYTGFLVTDLIQNAKGIVTDTFPDTLNFSDRQLRGAFKGLFTNKLDKLDKDGLDYLVSAVKEDTFVLNASLADEAKYDPSAALGRDASKFEKGKAELWDAIQTTGSWMMSTTERSARIATYGAAIKLLYKNQSQIDKALLTLNKEPGFIMHRRFNPQLDDTRAIATYLTQDSFASTAKIARPSYTRGTLGALVSPFYGMPGQLFEHHIAMLGGIRGNAGRVGALMALGSLAALGGLGASSFYLTKLLETVLEILRDEDTPGNLQLKQILVDNFGGKWLSEKTGWSEDKIADVAMGGLPTLLGTDLSQRVALQPPFLQYVDQAIKTIWTGTQANATDFLGIPGQLFETGANAVSQISQGRLDVFEAVKNLSPTAIKNAIQAGDYAVNREEGVKRTQKGKEIFAYSELSEYDMFLRLLGFTSLTERDAYTRNNLDRLSQQTNESVKSRYKQTLSTILVKIKRSTDPVLTSELKGEYRKIYNEFLAQDALRPKEKRMSSKELTSFNKAVEKEAKRELDPSGDESVNKNQVKARKENERFLVD